MKKRKRQKHHQKTKNLSQYQIKNINGHHGQSLKQKATPIIISIKKNAKTEIDGKIYKRDKLLAFVKKKLIKNPEQSVVIAADKKVKYGAVISLMDLLKQNEINKVGLLLKPEK